MGHNSRGAIVVGPYTRGAVHSPPATVHSPRYFFFGDPQLSVCSIEAFVAGEFWVGM